MLVSRSCIKVGARVHEQEKPVSAGTPSHPLHTITLAILTFLTGPFQERGHIVGIQGVRRASPGAT